MDLSFTSDNADGNNLNLNRIRMEIVDVEHAAPSVKPRNHYVQ